MRRPGALAVATLALLGLAGRVDAEEPKPPLGRHRLGPLYYTLRIELKSAGTDTNVHNSETEAVRDAAAVLTPRLDWGLPLGRRLTLKGRSFLNYNHFGSERSERSTDRGIAGRAELDLGRVELYAEVGGNRSKQRFTIELDERVWHRDTSIEAGLRLDLARRLSLTLKTARHNTTFDDVGGVSSLVKQTLDREGRSFGIEARYEVTARTSAMFLAEGRKDDFTVRLGDGPQAARSHRFLGGVELGRKAAVSGSLLAGVRRFPAGPDQGVPAHSGAVIEARVGTTLVPGLGLSASAVRDVYYSALPVTTPEETLRNSFVSSRFELQAAIELPLELLVRGVATHERSRYLLPYSVGDRDLERIERFRSLGLSVLKQVTGSLRVGVSLARLRRNSNLADNSYKGARYGLEAEWVP